MSNLQNFSESDQDEIIVEIYANRATISKLIELMQLAYQTIKSQNIVDLKMVKVKLALKIFDFFKDDSNKFENFSELADYLNIPLILRACRYAIISNSSGFNGLEDNILPLELIVDGFIPLSVINKALGLNSKNLNLNLIEQNIKTYEKLSDILINNINEEPFLHSYFDQIPSQELKELLIEKIKNILNTFEINRNSIKKFLNLLLVLPTDKITPELLDKLAQNINSFTGYDQILAKAFLYLNNHDTKNDILNEFNIDEARINNAKTNKILNLSNKNLGNPDNSNKLLFYIAIAQVLKITTLNTLFNKFRSLPPEIGKLTSLTKLNLHHNQLTSLPAEIGNLTNLTTLDLSGNQSGNLLTSLPTEIGNLTSLIYLKLSGNRLTSLPTEIGNLISLRQLTLERNQLENLPTEIGNLTSLTNLNLLGNRRQLTVLPAEIENLTQRGCIIDR